MNINENPFLLRSCLEYQISCKVLPFRKDGVVLKKITWWACFLDSPANGIIKLTPTMHGHWKRCRSALCHVWSSSLIALSILTHSAADPCKSNIYVQFTRGFLELPTGSIFTHPNVPGLRGHTYRFPTWDVISAVVNTHSAIVLFKCGINCLPR